ncbi:hypothetical protein MLD38_029916 [Melastoma candidum]|uniref:Uncharacterized protein n=1 Tax=Melastoma candidum TaxID=119954 RepID=A0ACB9MLZ7_9MYRT|nr:hypothetical protein MLD38_029916 [Melastoma candidum]
MAAQSPTTSDDQQAFKTCLLTLYVIALPTFLALHFIQAPYGKHRRPGWGPTIPSRLAWFLMESPTLWLTLALFPSGAHSFNPRSILLFFPFLLHYFHRVVLYPLRIPSSPSTSTPSPGFPVSIALMAFAFNLLNGYVQARSVSNYVDYGGETAAWFWGRFVAGAAIFVAGMVANVWADGVLTQLKAEGKGYRVPRGGLFEVVSCPNYLGEMSEWAGWAVMTWSWAGLGFFLYTFANLAPRARAHHRWYLEKFGEDYPKNRKAVIPFLY